MHILFVSPLSFPNISQDTSAWEEIEFRAADAEQELLEHIFQQTDHKFVIGRRLDLCEGMEAFDFVPEDLWEFPKAKSSEASVETDELLVTFLPDGNSQKALLLYSKDSCWGEKIAEARKHMSALYYAEARMCA